jgi:hypothetical protein
VVSSINIDAPNIEKGANINAGRNNVVDRYVPVRYICKGREGGREEGRTTLSTLEIHYLCPL